MWNRPSLIAAILSLSVVLLVRAEASPAELSVGVAGHAFDHLGGINEQDDASTASGATIIYATGLGGIGYAGLPTAPELTQAREQSQAYVTRAKSKGIRLAIGYVCATSIVKLDTFDKNWTPEFRAQFRTPPAEWLQRDKDGQPLPSWYGGDYRPACMSNPDWRAYEKFMVRQQIEAGHDGIFFDNPTIHPDGCYCDHCVAKFRAFLEEAGTKLDVPQDESVSFLRKVATERPVDFLRFRATVARDFIAEMRAFARTIKPDALVTCNNSLNTPESFYSQVRSFGYSIFELSKAEDFVVVEDMENQPRVLPDGTTAEYGPVYEMVHAISHGKPVVAVTIADGDYHTPPNLVRLAMAEAAAHGASYLSWPTWPEAQRDRMAKAIRPQADVLRRNEKLLNDTKPRSDVLLFLPFRRWVETTDCQPMNVARALGRANVQFGVATEENLVSTLAGAGIRKPVVLIESPEVLDPNEKSAVETYKANGGAIVWTAGNADAWLAEVRKHVEKPAVTLEGPTTLRAVVRDQPASTVVHLLNLNIQRLSSFEDKVTSANDVKVAVRVPFDSVARVETVTSDAGATRGEVPFRFEKEGAEGVVALTVPAVGVSTMLVVYAK